MIGRELPPDHPGIILKEMFIDECELTMTEVAEGLGMARANLSGIVNGYTGISPKLAIKLSEAFCNTAQLG